MPPDTPTRALIHTMIPWTTRRQESDPLEKNWAGLLAEFPAVVEIPVQWGDMDALAHVNNVVYFRWLESSRVRLIDSIAQVSTSNPTGVGPILASVKCDYRRQTRFPDIVSIGSRIDSVGKSSIKIRQAIISHDQEAIVAEGEAVLVLYDYAQGRSVPITDELRQILQSLTSRSADPSR